MVRRTEAFRRGALRRSFHGRAWRKAKSFYGRGQEVSQEESFFRGQETLVGRQLGEMIFYC